MGGRRRLLGALIARCEDFDRFLDWRFDGAARREFAAFDRHAVDEALRALYADPPDAWFYERWLHARHADGKRARGAYFTPAPLVDAVLDTLEAALRARRCCRRPWCEHLAVLDPALGSGIFLLRLAKRLQAPFPRLMALERDPATAKVARRLLSRHAAHVPVTIEVRGALTREFALDRGRFPVILGNPPYAARDEYECAWIRNLVADYRQLDGASLHERKHWLHDAYVKFLRAAQDAVTRAGEGLVGLITSHSFLDNPTFRGMRASLSTSFDSLDFCDLGGNAARGACDERRDENVFGVRSGIVITRLVKHAARGAAASSAKVRHVRLWGTKDEKFTALGAQSWEALPWETVPQARSAPRFVPQAPILGDRRLWESGIALTELFAAFSTGIISARDAVVYADSREELRARLLRFGDPRRDDEAIRREFFARRRSLKYPPGDTRGWKLPEARAALRNLDAAALDRAITPVWCRPFTRRFCFLHPAMVDWPRPALEPLWNRDQVALVACRQQVRPLFAHVLAVEGRADNCLLSTRSREGATVFPLLASEGAWNLSERGRAWIGRFPPLTAPSPGPQPQAGVEDKGGSRKAKGRRMKDPRTLSLLHPSSFIPHPFPFPLPPIFAWIYALLWTPAYRVGFEPLLAREFPRVLVPPDKERLRRAAALGARLWVLHLETARILDVTTAQSAAATASARWEAALGEFRAASERMGAPARWQIGAFDVLKNGEDPRRLSVLRQTAQATARCQEALDEALKSWLFQG